MTVPSEVLGELLQCGYRFALSLTHDEARAADLVQDAWTSVLQAKGPWSRAYLFATIRSRFIDHWRRERAVRQLPFDEAVASEWNGQVRDEEDERVSCATNGKLDEALASLRPQERAVLYLSVVEDYTAQDIADLFDWPRGTVLSHIHRARGKLKRYVASHPPDTSE